MIRTLFSTQSRKAWAGGIIAAGLTPILQLIAEGGSLNVGTAIAAVATGAITALGVYQIDNAKDPAALAVEQQAIAGAASAALGAARAHTTPAVAKQITEIATETSHLLEEATKDFGGQVVNGG